MNADTMSKPRVVFVLRSRVATISVFLGLTLTGCNVRLAPADPVVDNLKLTHATGPLPDAAFKAQLSFAYQFPDVVSVNRRLNVNLLVKNLSQISWPFGGQRDGKYKVQVGNRWLDSSGSQKEDAKGELPYDLQPGDTAEVFMVITTPQTPGSYTLEFDLVQEQVTWFRDHGSATLSVTLLVQ